MELPWIGGLKKLAPMFSTPKTVRSAAIVAAFHLLALAARAQHVLLAEDKGAMSVVVAAKGSDPCVEKDGRVVQIASKGFRLQDVPEYLPVFVTMSRPDAHIDYIDSSGAAINNNFHFSATLDTGYPLKDVFLVLDVNTQMRGKMILLEEIGHLEPNFSRPISLFIPMNGSFGSFSYRAHLFSEGMEVFQSQIPFWARQNALNKMIARRIEGVRSAAPSFFIGPAPIYPPDLVKEGITGRVVLSLMIKANGEIDSAVIKSATNPDFAKAATFAVQDWRFLPKVRDGYPVESKAEVPFIFIPPHAQ
jgi:TonB family protein